MDPFLEDQAQRIRASRCGRVRRKTCREGNGGEGREGVLGGNVGQNEKAWIGLAENTRCAPVALGHFHELDA